MNNKTAPLLTACRNVILLFVGLMLGQAALSAPTVITSSLPSGVVGLPYNQTLQASGTGQLTWALTAGTLPGGLSLSTGGIISGTPNTPGTFNFNVRVTDATGGTTQSLFIVIDSGPVIVTSTLPNATVGVAYSQQVQIAGGVGIKTFAIGGGALPGGLALNSSTGVISGTPNATGTFTFSVSVTDSATNQSARSLSISVAGPGSPPTIATTTLPNAAVATSYSQQLQVSGGTAPFNWTIVAGALPPGLTLDAASALISGTPSTAGTFSFSVRVTDARAAQATQALSITVVGPAPPSITTTSLPDGFLNMPYSQPLQVSGGSSPFTWAITAGALPPGLSLGAGNGVISGTPSSAGSFNFTVQVTSGTGAQAARALAININAGPAITTTTLPDAEVGRAYSQQLQAAGGTGAFTWALTAGALPVGFTLSSSGAITGTPVTAGTASFTVSATDAASASATKPLTIIVNAPAPGVLQFSSATYSVDENGGSAIVTVIRTGGSAGPLLASVGTSGGSATPAVDYAFTFRTITFDDGVTTPKDVVIPIVDDTLSEGPETFGVTLANAGGVGVLPGPRSSATVTIIDNEPAPTSGGGGGGGGGGCATSAGGRDASLLMLLLLGALGWGRQRLRQRLPRRIRE